MSFFPSFQPFPNLQWMNTKLYSAMLLILLLEWNKGDATKSLPREMLFSLCAPRFYIPTLCHVSYTEGQTFAKTWTPIYQYFCAVLLLPR